VKTDELTATSEYVPLLTWKYTNDKMAWGVLLLMGGGFALADGCAVSLTFLSLKHPTVSTTRCLNIFLNIHYYTSNIYATDTGILLI